MVTMFFAVKLMARAGPLDFIPGRVGMILLALAAWRPARSEKAGATNDN